MPPRRRSEPEPRSRRSSAMAAPPSPFPAGGLHGGLLSRAPGGGHEEPARPFRGGGPLRTGRFLDRLQLEGIDVDLELHSTLHLPRAAGARRHAPTLPLSEVRMSTGTAGEPAGQAGLGEQDLA